MHTLMSPPQSSPPLVTLCRARGGELFDHLTQMVKLSEKKSRHIVHQLLLAVCHMHIHDVVHRDLKPENILLDENLDLKVSDLDSLSN